MAAKTDFVDGQVLTAEQLNALGAEINTNAEAVTTEAARAKAAEALKATVADVGDKANLNTTEKGSIVGAVNEVAEKATKNAGKVTDLEQEVGEMKEISIDLTEIATTQNCVVGSSTGKNISGQSEKYAASDFIDISLCAGLTTKFKSNFSSWFGASLYDSNKSLIQSINTATSGVSAGTQTVEIIIPTNAVYLRITLFNNIVITDYPVSASVDEGVMQKICNVEKKVDKLSNNIVKENIIEVGSGKDYEDLREAIESITDSSSSNTYKIYVYEGTYNMVDTDKIAAGYYGLTIPDYVSIIGIGNRENIVLNGIVTDTSFASLADNISTINYRGNGSVENVTIKAKNIRYCIHDDSSDGTMFGRSEHTYKRVKFVYDAPDDGFSGLAASCIGIGNECDKYVIFDSCEFVNNYTGKFGILYHDNGNTGTTAELNGARLDVKNCIFTTDGVGSDIVLLNSGGQCDCYANIINNYMLHGLCIMSASSSITTNVWYAYIVGNKNYSLTKRDYLKDVDLSSYITEFGNV